jgi:hypothetical protein
MSGDYWDHRKARFGLGPTPQPTVYHSPVATGDNPAYAEAALREEATNVANATEGVRNHTLNVAAFNLASLVAAGALDEYTVKDTLASAAASAGLSDVEIRATITSGFSGSAAKVGARAVPAERVDVEEAKLALSNGHAKPSEGESDADFLRRREVAIEAHKLRVRDEGRILWRQQRAELMGQRRPEPVALDTLLAQPDPAVVYRITDLLPAGGRALLSAQYKAGKTSMIANLLRSLVDGDRFLGRFDVEPVERVWLLDTELDQDMLRRWLRDQNIRNRAAIQTLCLKGRLTTFGITDDTVRAEWAAMMGGADFIVLDCLRPCLDALGLSEDKEAGIFLTAFDALCHEATAKEAVVVQHMGHGQERSRGDSRQLDWPDVLWRIVREESDDGAGDRYFSALGRDVNVPETVLSWIPEVRGLMLGDGDRADKRARSTVEDIVEILSEPANVDGLSQNKLVGKLKGMGASRDGARRAVALAVTDGVLLAAKGPRNSDVHILNPSRRH